MAKKGAIEPAPADAVTYISNIILVEKKGGQMCPVINLCPLNRLVRYRHLKIEGIHLLRYTLLQGDWVGKLALKDVHLMVPIYEMSRRLL